MTCLALRVSSLWIFAAATLTCAAGPQAFGQGLGCDPSPSEAFATHARVHIAAKRGLDRPKHFSLAADLPPVGNQGGTSACVGWSTAYYCYTTSIARQRQLTPEQRKDPRFVFSPAFIWHQYNMGDKEKGMHIFEAFDILAKQGCAAMADMPWVEADVTSQPDEKAKTHALRYRARQTVSLFKGKLLGEEGDAEKLKNWLWETKQPFVIGIAVYKEFYTVPHDPEYVYRPSENKGTRAGFHAICIVGYDEDKHAFLMVNSWTTAWGNKGFLWLHEDFVTQEALEGWGQRPGGPISRGLRVKTSTPSISYEPAAKTQ